MKNVLKDKEEVEIQLKKNNNKYTELLTENFNLKQKLELSSPSNENLLLSRQ